MMTSHPYQSATAAGQPFPTPTLPMTGYRDLDDAHTKISAHLSELGTQIERGSFSDATTSAVALLFVLREDYAIEEALMFRTGFPDYARHQASHAVLEQTFSELSRSIRSAAAGVPDAASHSDLLALLQAGCRMLAAHVTGADVALTRHVLDRATASRTT